MEIVNSKIEAYINDRCSAHKQLLEEIERDTYANVLLPRMLSGEVQGRVLSMISHMIKPSAILEIGTFTGYSALCLAEGLTDDGRLDTIDINEELEDRTRNFFNKSEYAKNINYVIGDARDKIKELEGPYDLSFVDADKSSYQQYYDLILPKTKVGGFILIDNVLWSGKVLGRKDGKKIDKDTQAIIEFNDALAQDNRVEKVILSVRDGLFLVRRIS
jgi:predicted O-methyltransferase YrrM